MINAVHMLLYSKDAAADRAFLRDVLRFPHVDEGGGWLIFKLPPAEVGVHPVMHAGGSGGVEFHFMCDDLEATLAELTANGVETLRPPSKEDWGIATSIRLPGGSEVGLYQPLHSVAYGL